MATHEVSYYDKAGAKVNERLCELHGTRRPRDSWYVCKRFLHTIAEEAPSYINPEVAG